MLKFEQVSDDRTNIFSGELKIATIARFSKLYTFNPGIWFFFLSEYLGQFNYSFETLEDAKAFANTKWNEWLDEAGLQIKQPSNDNAELLSRIERLERALHMRTQHIVNKGDTLSSIALLYYGESNQWQAIYRANKHVIGNNPDYLSVGQVLTLPRI